MKSLKDKVSDNFWPWNNSFCVDRMGWTRLSVDCNRIRGAACVSCRTRIEDPCQTSNQRVKSASPERPSTASIALALIRYHILATFVSNSFSMSALEPNLK